MKLGDHVVVVVSLVVLGASAILGATVQSSASCPWSGTASENAASTELCARGVDAECLPAIPLHAGQHLVRWGVTGGCFGARL